VKVVEIDQPLDINAARPAERGTGLHVSEIYGSLFQELEPTRFIAGSKPNDILMAIGLAWEQWLERTLQAMGELVERPGELISPEGILYSPDLFVVNGKDRIGEIKSTQMSSREGMDSPKFAKFHCQAMIYGYWTGIPRARFYILFLRGDYARSGPSGLPQYRVFDVEYGARELQENHSMLMNFARSKGML
jgi:hypothetical protein